MRIIGAEARVPSPKESIPTSLRLSERRTHSAENRNPTACFDIWRTRNADEDDERIALGDWLQTPSSAQEHSPSSLCTTEPWLTAFLLVTFDHDKGQLLEACVPPRILTQAEQDTACFHAMPDSASLANDTEDALFSFRIPRRMYPSESTASHISVASTRLLLAHTLFRQAPDKSTPRGFFQKALVIVTSAPYLGLPAAMLSILAPKAFVHGQSALEKAFKDLSEWPDPRLHSVDRTLFLPFVGDIIPLNLPDSFLVSFSAPSADGYMLSTKQLDGVKLDESPTALTSYPDVDPWDISMSGHPGAVQPDAIQSWTLCYPAVNRDVALFHEVNAAVALNGAADYLTSIWEIVAVGEPLLVYAPTPTACSAAVMTIIGLIHPLPFIGDWRPYFCIHDNDYLNILETQNVHDLFPDGAVLGVSSLHLAETMKFPHIFSLPSSGRNRKASRARLISSFRPSCMQRGRLLRHSFMRAILAHQRSGLYESTRTAQEFRKCILEKITRPFLRAFDRYLTPTWGNQKRVTDEPYRSDPFDKTLRLIPFQMDAFPTTADISPRLVSSLFKKGSSWKYRVRLLYQRFVQGPVFREWWHQARISAERDCVVAHRRALLDACRQLTGVFTLKLSADDARDSRSLQTVVDLASRVHQELSKTAYGDTSLLESLQNLLTSLKLCLPDGYDQQFDIKMS